MLRVPSSLPKNSTIAPENLYIACYLPTDSISTLKINRSLTKLVHLFAEEVATPHLSRLKKHHEKIGDTPTLHSIPNSGATEFDLAPIPDALHPCFYTIPGKSYNSFRAYLNQLDEVEYDMAANVIDWSAAEADMKVIEADLGIEAKIKPSTSIFAFDVLFRALTAFF